MGQKQCYLCSRKAQTKYVIETPEHISTRFSASDYSLLWQIRRQSRYNPHGTTVITYRCNEHPLPEIFRIDKRLVIETKPI